MIKNLFLTLCAASLVGTASAGDNPFTVAEKELDWLVTGQGTYSQLLEALDTAGATESGYDFIRFGEKGGDSATVIFSKADDVHTPFANTIEFANAILEFQDLVTLIPNEISSAGPGMVAGYIIGWAEEEPFGPIVEAGELTISITESAIDNWLQDQPSLDNIASWSLLANSAQIQPTPGAIVTFQVIDDQGKVIVPQGGQLHYKDQTYTNKGIVWNEGDLKQSQMALLFVPGGEMEQWGGGGFNVLALGENYTPVPEPATGTLSLLALAGLAARRRRK